MRAGSRRRLWLGGALAALAVGCATAKEAAGMPDDTRPRIESGSLSGLPASQLREVEARRAELEKARQVELQARRDERALSAQVDDAKRRLELAKQAGEAVEEGAPGTRAPEVGEEQRTVEEAHEQAEDAAEATERMAHARVEYAEALRDYARRRVEVANRIVAWEQGRVDSASYAALQRSNPQEARRIEPNASEFARRVGERQRRLEDARATQRDGHARAESKFKAWQEATAAVTPSARGEPMPALDAIPPL